MAVGKEIRGKIKSVENTKKITKAMEMVAASKMRKAQERMRAARPYADKIRNITANLSQANPEYKSPYMRDVAKVAGSSKAVGFIVVTTDKGLCGGLNTNVLRALTNKMREVTVGGGSVQTVAIGNKGFGFLNRISAPIMSHVVQLGDAPQLEKLIGPVKVMRNGVPLLHEVHQYDEAGAARRAAVAAGRRAPVAQRGRTGRWRRKVRLGLHLRA
jgi:F-type H+-transporting ATPase subunit gamma